MRTPLLPLLLAGLTGCSLFFDDEVQRAECAVDTDCLEPIRERCDPVRLRCVPRGPSEVGAPDPDEGPADRGPGDLGLDAGPDMAVDLGPDQGPDLGADAAAPMATCFAEHAPGTVTDLDPSTGAAPWGFCTPAGLAWLHPAEGGLSLVLRRHPDAEPEALALLPADARPVVGGGAVYYVTPNPDQGATPNVRRVDLATGEAQFVLARPAAQGQPAVWAQDLAFVESEGGRGGVVLSRTVGLSQCRDREASQWGPTLGPDWAAWFERGPRGRVEVVVSRGAGCEGRVAVPLSGAVPQDARLHAAGHYLVWLQPAADGRQHLWRLNRDRLVDGPLDLDGERPVHRVELVTDGVWAATTRYTPGLYVVEALWPADPEVLVLTPDPLSARHVSVGGGQLLWAEQNGRGQWRLQHQPLPPVEELP